MALQWRGSLTGEDRKLGTVYKVLMHQGKFAAARELPERKDCGTFDSLDEARKACDESSKGDKEFTPPEPQAAEKPPEAPKPPPPPPKPASDPPKPAHAPSKGRR